MERSPDEATGQKQQGPPLSSFVQPLPSCLRHASQGQVWDKQNGLQALMMGLPHVGACTELPNHVPKTFACFDRRKRAGLVVSRGAV